MNVSPAIRRPLPWVLPLLLFAAACEERSPLLDTAAATLPPELCPRAARGLDDLRAEGALLFDGSGNPWMETTMWQALGADRRDMLVNALAVHAACARERMPAEEEVRLLNEFGVPLVTRTVELRADLELLRASEPPAADRR